MERSVIVNLLDNVLEPHLIDDSTINGLQIEGKAEIQKVGFAVDSCVPVFEEAVRQSIDMLVVHHGLIWGSWRSVLGADRKKLALLLKHDINLYVSHLPLDKNFQYGNNTRIIDALGATIGEPVLGVAYLGEFCDELSYSDFEALITEKMGLKGRMHFGPETIKKFAVSSGSFRPSWIQELCDMGIHTLITGEGSSASLLYYPAQECEMNVIFCGHYATETFGVKALKKMMDKELKGLDTVFIDRETGW